MNNGRENKSDRLRVEETRQVASGVHAGHRARLRESVARDNELTAFSDIELLELMLAFSVPRRDTNVTAHKLLDKFGSLIGVLNADENELLSVSGVTVQSATVIGLLRVVTAKLDGMGMKLVDRRGAIDFFALMFISGDKYGTYAAFLDESFRVIAIEFFDSDAFPARGVIRSVCKYAARYVFLARRQRNVLSGNGLANSVGRLAELFAAVGAHLLDCIMLIDNGYYTVGPQPTSGEWSPTYVFVPAAMFSDSTELYEFVMSSHPPQIDERTASPSDDLHDLLAQVKMAVERKME